MPMDAREDVEMPLVVVRRALPTASIRFERDHPPVGTRHRGTDRLSRERPEQDTVIGG
jgi:hypothetical protein